MEYQNMIYDEEQEIARFNIPGFYLKLSIRYTACIMPLADLRKCCRCIKTMFAADYAAFLKLVIKTAEEHHRSVYRLEKRVAYLKGELKKYE